MGKGKGNYSRIVYKVFANKMFMEFKKKNIYTLLKIKKFLKKKNNLKTHY
jgi:hypothetical protein